MKAIETIRRKQIIWMMALVLLIGFGLRVHRLAYDSIWWDEGYSIWMSRFPIEQMLFETAHDAHPPLSYAMLNGWMALMGDEEFALRMQSVLFGMLTIAFAYQTGREVGGRRAAMAGALLVAVSRLPVWWSQEVRMYAPAACFAALSLWMSLRLFDDRRKLTIPAVILALSTGFGLLTLYLYAGAVIALNLAALLAFAFSARRWKLARAWIGSQVGALVLFVPWVIFALDKLPSWVAPQAPVVFGEVIKLYLGVIFLGIATSLERYSLLLILGAVILIGAMVLGFIAAGRGKRVAWGTLLIGVLLPPIMVYLLSIPRGAFNAPTPSPRYFLLLSTPVYVLLGWGMVSLNRYLRHVGSAVLALLVGIGLWSLSVYYPGLYLSDDYGSMAATIEAMRGENDAVLLNNDTDWPIFAYHYDEQFDRHITRTQIVGDEKYAEDLLEDYRGAVDAVWLVQTQYAGVTDPDNQLWLWLDSKSWHTVEYPIPEGQLWYFALTQERADQSRQVVAEGRADALQSVDVPITEGVVNLTGYTRVVPDVRAGDSLTIGLAWQTTEKMKGEWTVAVKLIGADGEEIASTLVPLVAKRPNTAERFQLIEVFIPPDVVDQSVQVVFVAGETWKPLTEIRIRPRLEDRAEAVDIPTGVVTQDVDFGGLIRLAAVDLPDTMTWKPGEAIPITFYWDAMQPMGERYKVFIHLIGDEYNSTNNSFVWGQQDQEPGGGATPTTGWIPGRFIADGYLVTLSEDALSGRYRVMVGFYLPLDGLRLSVEGGDSWQVFEIDVR